MVDFQKWGFPESWGYTPSHHPCDFRMFHETHHFFWLPPFWESSIEDHRRSYSYQYSPFQTIECSKGTSYQLLGCPSSSFPGLLITICRALLGDTGMVLGRSELTTNASGNGESPIETMGNHKKNMGK